MLAFLNYYLYEIVIMYLFSNICNLFGQIFSREITPFVLFSSFSESYFTVKGAALILPQSDYETAFARKVTKSHGGKKKK